MNFMNFNVVINDFCLSFSSTVTSTAAPATAATVAAGSLTFTQLEDQINKWTIDLEDQAKIFINQAKQLNAWDRLLISNGEKVRTECTKIVCINYFLC